MLITLQELSDRTGIRFKSVLRRIGRVYGVRVGKHYMVPEEVAEGILSGRLPIPRAHLFRLRKGVG